MNNLPRRLSPSVKLTLLTDSKIHDADGLKMKLITIWNWHKKYENNKHLIHNATINILISHATRHDTQSINANSRQRHARTENIFKANYARSRASSQSYNTCAYWPQIWRLRMGYTLHAFFSCECWVEIQAKHIIERRHIWRLDNA